MPGSVVATAVATPMPATVAAAVAVAATMAGTAVDRHCGAAAGGHDAAGNMATPVAPMPAMATVPAPVHDLPPATAVDFGFRAAAVAAGSHACSRRGDNPGGAATLAMHQFAATPLVHFHFRTMLQAQAAGTPAGRVHDTSAATTVDQFGAATFVHLHLQFSRRSDAGAQSKRRGQRGMQDAL